VFASHSMLKCPNPNILDEWIIIALRNWSLKGLVKSLINQAIVELVNYDMLLDDAIVFKYKSNSC
jgi:hypothetical protein